MNTPLEQLSYAQQQRLAYIDFKLYFTGSVTRAEIVQHFKLGVSAATRDINLYKEHAPKNMAYDNKEKKYFLTNSFTPLFKHDAKRTLVKLAHQISDGFDAIGSGEGCVEFPVEQPSQLNVPDINVIAKLTQAMVNGKAVSVIYTSLTSGSSARELVPHTIVDNGLRWHVRAYDRKTNSFRDFVLTRLAKVTVINNEPEVNEIKLQDEQWNTIMPLEIVPHPKNVEYPTAIKMDYGMENGMLKLNVRAAMAGYLLRRWNVDCSDSASLSGPEYQLYLQNSQTLEMNQENGAENLAIAPGYQQH
ncbi:WYL domain-containing protein [Thalassotalea piscium]|nr:WYL domain-containing protein [Thalassotalea piscium]